MGTACVHANQTMLYMQGMESAIQVSNIEEIHMGPL